MPVLTVGIGMGIGIGIGVGIGIFPILEMPRYLQQPSLIWLVTLEAPCVKNHSAAEISLKLLQANRPRLLHISVFPAWRLVYWVYGSWKPDDAAYAVFSGDLKVGRAQGGYVLNTNTNTRPSMVCRPGCRHQRKRESL